MLRRYLYQSMLRQGVSLFVSTEHVFLRHWVSHNVVFIFRFFELVFLHGTQVISAARGPAKKPITQTWYHEYEALLIR